MRFFCEESKSGTIELLLTMPLSDFAIVFGKFLAGIVLLFFSLLPTILYYVTVYALGSPVGNVDTGAVIGAYIGLFLLGGMYLAIGTFLSSLTDNQIIAFILTAAICFIFYIGFEFVSELVPDVAFLTNVGISEHYNSISRGVIDTRDIVYYLGFIGFFLYCTTLSIAKKRK
jgi:ABC-2 type transport system permease protein